MHIKFWNTVNIIINYSITKDFFIGSVNFKISLLISFIIALKMDPLKRT